MTAAIGAAAGQWSRKTRRPRLWTASSWWHLGCCWTLRYHFYSQNTL